MADACWLFAFSLAIRALVVAWAWHRFPPADDGTFYHVVAQRIAQGDGYTWLWPDGAVTYAAHYPVGYPALIGAAYALFGARPVVAMGLNAVLGAFAVFAAQRVVIRRNSRSAALIAGLLVSLHPGLVFYTPALMTEGVAAELLVVAVWLALRADDRGRPAWRLVALGMCMGIITLVRPQLLVMAPILGFFALGTRAKWYSERALRAFLVSFLAVSFCLPWTIRNCKRMDRCVFVSANGGWNLLIGAGPEGNGAWRPIEGSSVPPECRNVFGEADKDRCFGRAGWQKILRDPLSFLALIPRKLSVTFDYFGAPGHYLNTSNFHEFDESRKLLLGEVETVWERLVLLAAIAQAAVRGAARRRLRWLSGAAAGLFALSRSGWLGYLGLVVTSMLSGRKLVHRPIAALAASLTLVTALTHAVFFGAGRYGFVCAALLCLAAVGERELRAGFRAAAPAPVEEAPSRRPSDGARESF
ncbi:MAG TPA: glycosyltransferase family 39 protein [Polyangiaceae bacterium]|nr:glycosyltransferase family 39 protein [Polyangiaceae bacterium]